MHPVKKVQVHFHAALHFSIKNFTIHQNVPYSFKRKTLQISVITQWAIFFEKSGNGMYVTCVAALLLNNFTTKNATMVFCYQNCSDLLWERIVLVIEKNIWNSRLKAKNLRSLEQFWYQNALTYCEKKLF